MAHSCGPRKILTQKPSLVITAKGQGQAEMGRQWPKGQNF